MIFLLIFFGPIVVLAWTASPAVGVVASGAFLVLAVIGSDTWSGSGSYRRRRP